MWVLPTPRRRDMQLPASQPRCWEPKAAARLGQVCLWWSHPALRPLHPQPCPCCCGSGPRGRDCVLLECDTPQLASTSGPTGNRSIRAVEGAWMLPRALRPLEGWLSGIGFLVVEGSTDQLPASCFGPLSSWKTCFVCCFFLLAIVMLSTTLPASSPIKTWLSQNQESPHTP